MFIIGLYILAASVAPVWILLQPRDYLSSYLLYGMIILAVVGIVGASVTGDTANCEIPAFAGFNATELKAAGLAASGNASSAATVGNLFPALFITIACGAISGFHSLVASGTTSKQLDREAHAQPIAYGGMLLECLLAVISLCAVAFVFQHYMAGDAGYATPTAIFAHGLSQMVGTIPGLGGEATVSIVYSLLILAVSAFCLTSLDTATRICRMMFQEMFLKPGEDASQVTGARKILVSVALGIALGMNGYSIIWPLFGAANQLLAALALLAVCAFLGNIGRNNKMFYIPMVFMLIVTLTSLVQTAYAKLTLLAGPGEVLAAQAGGVFGVGAQLVLAVLLLILAVILAVKGAKVIFGKKDKASA